MGFIQINTVKMTIVMLIGEKVKSFGEVSLTLSKREFTFDVRMTFKR